MIHTGANAHDIGMYVPAATQSAVMAADDAAYIIDLVVSRFRR